MHHILMPFKYLDACRTRNAFLFKIKVNFFFFSKKKSNLLGAEEKHTHGRGSQWHDSHLQGGAPGFWKDMAGSGLAERGRVRMALQT